MTRAERRRRRSYAVQRAVAKINLWCLAGLDWECYPSAREAPVLVDLAGWRQFQAAHRDRWSKQAKKLADNMAYCSCGICRSRESQPTRRALRQRASDNDEIKEQGIRFEEGWSVERASEQ